MHRLSYKVWPLIVPQSQRWGIPLFLAAALFLSVNPTAHSEDPAASVIGVGQESCEVWLEKRSDALASGSRAWFHEEWVLGYITAINRWVHDGKELAPDVDDDRLFEWLDGYCRKNPQQTLSFAAEAMILKLGLRESENRGQ